MTGDAMPSFRPYFGLSWSPRRGVRPFAGVSFRRAHGVGLVILLVILIAMWAALAHAGELEDKLF